jgi:hypothetical protein
VTLLTVTGPEGNGSLSTITLNSPLCPWIDGYPPSYRNLRRGHYELGVEEVNLRILAVDDELAPAI